MAQQHLRNILASLDVPTLGQPEAFIQAKEGLFDEAGNVGAGSRLFLQGFMDRYASWVRQHAVSGREWLMAHEAPAAELELRTVGDAHAGSWVDRRPDGAALRKASGADSP
jgi:hypothetical protein